MEWAAKGATALAADDQADVALLHYTKALIEHPHSPDYFTQRAAAFSRLKPARHALALRDAEYAVLLGRQRAKREKIQAAQQRRVVALYGLGMYTDAKYILETMMKWRKKDDKKDKMENDIWMAKINTKLKSEDSTEPIVKEFPETEIPNEKNMRQILQQQIQSDGKFSFDGENVREDFSTAEVMQDRNREDRNSIQTSVASPKASIQPVRHDFYQNNDSVIISFYAKKVDASKVSCKFLPNSVVLSFPHPDSPTLPFTFSADPTYSTIDTTNSTYKVFGTKVELTLAKEEKGQKWITIESKGAPTVQKALSTPYASTRKNQDWDKTVAELSKKKAVRKPAEQASQDTTSPSTDKDDDDDASDADSEFGGDAVDGFFKKLYAGADSDTRRAMMKSMSESNGTSLSTNWESVSKGRVDEVKSKDEQ